MAKMYYVCNHVDKVEIQCSTLSAAKKAWAHAVDDMFAKVIFMFELSLYKEINSDEALQRVRELFYVKGVDYVREEVIYNAADLKGIDDEQH